MKDNELIQVLRDILKEDHQLSKDQRQVIRNFIYKEENEGVTAQDLIDLVKCLFGITKLIQKFLE